MNNLMIGYVIMVNVRKVIKGKGWPCRAMVQIQLESELGLLYLITVHRTCRRVEVAVLENQYIYSSSGSACLVTENKKMSV